MPSVLLALCSTHKRSDDTQRDVFFLVVTAFIPMPAQSAANSEPNAEASAVLCLLLHHVTGAELMNIVTPAVWDLWLIRSPI